MTKNLNYNSAALVKILFYLFPVLTVIRMMRWMGWLYYATQAILLLFILIFAYSVIKNKIDIKKVLNKNLLILYAFSVWATLTALWSINPVSSALKGLNFVFVVTGILSGILLLISQNEKNILKYILPANILVIITSLFSLIFHFPADAWTIGHGLSFAGFFTHQNVLAMAALFTLPGVFGLRAKSIEQSVSRDNTHKWSFGYSLFDDKRQLLFFLLLTSNFLLIILTYSRSVILALIVFGLLWLILNKKKKVLAFTGFIVAVLIILALINKDFNTLSVKLLNKHNYSFLESRAMLWDPSVKAAEIGGVLGIGYGMSVPGIFVSGTESEHINEKNYYREKGNLALALIEETGVAGLLLFASFVIFVLIKSYKFRSNYLLQLIFITIIALLIQSNFEGWSGGGNQMMQLFLIFNIYSFSNLFYKNI